MLIADSLTLPEASHRQVMCDHTMRATLQQTGRQSIEDTGRMIIEETSTDVMALTIEEM